MTEAESFSWDVEELFSKRLRAFCVWAEKEWSFSPQQMLDPAKLEGELDLTPEQMEGWNRALASLEGAADMWLEEYPYT